MTYPEWLLALPYHASYDQSHSEHNCIVFDICGVPGRFFENDVSEWPHRDKHHNRFNYLA